MPLRIKLFIGFGFITLSLFSILILLSNLLISAGFSSVEVASINKSVNQAYDGIQTVIDQMEVKIGDWAAWDDTYTFVQDHNQEYVDLNLNYQALEALRVDLVVVLDNEAEIVGSFAINPFSGEEEPLPQELIPHISKGSLLLDFATIDDQYRGFLNLASAPLALVSRPILTNSGEGPAKGTLIFGKYLESETEASVEGTTHLEMNLYRYDDPDNPTNIKNIAAKYPSNESIINVPISENSIAGYITINDVYGKPILLLEETDPRSIYNQGKKTINYFLIFSLVSCGIFILFGVLFIDKFLTGRISRISKYLTLADPVNHSDLKINDSGNDEVGTLSKSINSMFIHIYNSSQEIKSLLGQIQQEKAKVEETVVERTIELRDEKAKLIASIESMDHGYLLLDNKFNIVLGNSAVAKILGDFTGGLNLISLQNKFGQGIDLKKELDNCISNRKSYEHKEFIFGTKFLKFYISPIFMDDIGKPKSVGALILISDVTEEKVLQRSKDEFFSIASHELRTPLSIIRGNMSIALEYYVGNNTDKDLSEIIKESYDSSVQLIAIVNDFLNMSKLEQGKMTFSPVVFDISRSCHEVVKALSLKAKEKNISLRLDNRLEGKLEVKADTAKTKEVLINLCMNAINYTEKGGVTVDVYKNNNSAIIEVSDTGRGIPEEQQSLLFRKFQQAGQSIYTRDAYKGTGLGLYISKMIIENMGGTIYLKESLPGKGSVFVFTLPLA